MPYLKKEKALFLDLFYQYYPEEYTQSHVSTYNTKEMYQAIQRDWPAEFDEVMVEYSANLVA